MFAYNLGIVFFFQEKHETQALCAKDCCNRACLQRRVLQYVPCIGIMKDYKPKHQLVADVVAGIVVAIVAIPQGMHTLTYCPMGDMAVILRFKLIMGDGNVCTRREIAPR